MPEVLASSGFSVRQAGPNTFTIVFGNSGKSVQKFAVMDLMGAVVQKGETHLRETSVSLQNTGTYIIRVGNESRQSCCEPPPLLAAWSTSRMRKKISRRAFL